MMLKTVTRKNRSGLTDGSVSPAFVLVMLAVCVFVTFGCRAGLAGGVRLNEVLTANTQGIFDGYDDHEDWFELYNSGASDIDLKGYTVTDDAASSGGWAFPSVVVPAGGYLLVWASGEDHTEPTELHTDFGLEREGEYLALHEPDGTLVDSVDLPELSANVSYARRPDGGWGFFPEPTPRQENTTPSFDGIAAEPSFWQSPGSYDYPMVVQLSCPTAGATIRYTTDASEPDAGSSEYDAPFIVESTTIVRARAFRDDLVPSPAATAEYLIGEENALPVLSLSTDPPNLWDADRGIYEQFLGHGEQWERPARITFFEEDGSMGFSVNAGLRIHGGSSRWSPKKGFRLFFRDSYGSDELVYPLFPRAGRTHFKRLVVRTSGNDQQYMTSMFTLMRDALMHQLALDADITASDSRPAAVYLNGEYWGIYNIREFIRDDRFLEKHFGTADVEVRHNFRELTHGDTSYWMPDYVFFRDNDPRLDAYYYGAQRRIDLADFTDYQIVNIYGANIDWPLNNYDRGRAAGGTSRWRWIFWDNDYCFANRTYYWPDGNSIDHNTLAMATAGSPWPHGANGTGDEYHHTMMLRRLLDNRTYRPYFITRFADLLNTLLDQAHVLETIDERTCVIQPDIARETTRWGATPDEWEANVEFLREFARLRPDILRGHIIEKFGLKGTARLTVDPPEGDGDVQVNSISLDTYPWEGVYFRGVPVTLRAKPRPGYRFAGWSDPDVPQEQTLELSLTADCSIHALFEPSVMPGTVKWSVALPAAVNTSPALADDGTVYVGCDDGNLYAITSTGMPALIYETGDSIRSSAMIDDDGRIYFGSDDGSLYIVGADGRALWSFEDSSRPMEKVRPTPALGPDGNILFGADNARFYSIDRNGTANWVFTGAGGRIRSQAAVLPDGTALFGCEDGYLYCLTPDGDLRWRTYLGGDVTAPVVAPQGIIYATGEGGAFTALDLDGAVLWTSRLGDDISAAPVITGDGTLLVGSLGGNLYRLGVSGALLGAQDLGQAVAVSAAVGLDGSVHLASQDFGLHAFRYDEFAAGAVTELWHRPLDEVATGSTSAPIIGPDGTLYVGSNDGTVFAMSTTSEGPGAVPRPMAGRDVRHTGRAELWVFHLDVSGGEGSGDYLDGTVVPISADIPDQQRFLRWMGDLQGVLDAGSPQTAVQLHTDTVISAVIAPMCTGDANLDGCVNVADLLTVRNNLGKTGSDIDPPQADIHPEGVPDGIVNIADLLLVRNHLGECR